MKGKKPWRSEQGKAVCVEATKRWQLSHRDRINERRRELRKLNPEKFRARDLARLERDRENRNAQCRKYYQANKDAAAENMRAWRELHGKAFEKKRAVYKKLMCTKRHAIKKGATIGPTEEINSFCRWVYTAPNVKCYWCKEFIPKGKRQRQIDHVIPLSKGGAHSIENIVASCRRCNCRKSNKLPHEFTGQHELF